MTLSDFAAIGSCVSTAVTLVSLIYLVIQVREAKTNQEASIRQARTNRICDMNMKVTEPALADAVAKGFSADPTISATQLVQFTYFCRATFFSFEDSYCQHQDRVLSSAAFKAILTNVKDLCALPGMQAQWRDQRAAFDITFVEFMDDLVGSVELSKQIGALAQPRGGASTAENPKSASTTATC